MKRKTRTITVNHQKYIWWYCLGGNTLVKLSPFHDKTATITVEFPCDNPNKMILGEGFPEYIVMYKNYQEYTVKTIAPKMAGLLLSYLTPDAFVSRKDSHYNGFDLLTKMGYTISEVKEGFYW